MYQGKSETLLLAIFGQILALKPPQSFKKTAKNWLVSLKPPNDSDDNQNNAGSFNETSYINALFKITLLRCPFDHNFW